MGIESNEKQNLENLSKSIIGFSSGIQTETYFASYQAPLYGRRTAQMKIMPFNFEECCTYLSALADEDKALIYGIVGGTPQYLLQMSDKLSVEDNIKNTYLNPMSFLYEEPVNLLKQEVREPAIYNAIITAIATGHSRMSEISTKVGDTVCSGYIKRCPRSLFTPSRITCFISGIVLFRIIILRLYVEQRLWFISESKHSSVIIWAECLKRFVCSICGNCFLVERCLLNLPLLAAGGEMIQERKFRWRLTLWVSRTAIQQSLLSVNGEMMGNVTLVSYEDIARAMK